MFFLRSRFLLLLVSCLCLNTLAAKQAFTSSHAQTFDYAWLKGEARNLAAKPYTPASKLPASLQKMTWDEYQQISFQHEKALWTQKNALFRAEFFHLGLFFQEPVRMHLLQKGQAAPLLYTHKLFSYGKSGIKGSSLPKNLGFAGFRIFAHTDWSRDLLAFLGASYFRAVGAEMQYGMSARGLAVDTALPKPEEFPRFTDFWLEEPEPGKNTLTIYALLNSPSITGAYRFDCTPGEPFLMQVDAALYPRRSITRLGIAPLTSMFMTGENDRRMHHDWRPEIHDSDGLALLTGAQEWIWRPLGNPETLRFNAYQDHNPRGFGLLQRDRNFDHYQDDGVFYEKRPGVWVEPKGDWGAGAVVLVEIPTLDETFDNIVAFWNPAKPVLPGQELLYSYTLYWGADAIPQTNLASVVNTFTGLGGIVGQKRTHYSQRFVVDFAGGSLPLLGTKTTVRPVITASSGEIELPSAREQRFLPGYRAMFDLVPADDTQTPINIRLHLEANGIPLTETWQYQWTPPAPEKRALHNPGHLR